MFAVTNLTCRFLLMASVVFTCFYCSPNHKAGRIFLYLTKRIKKAGTSADTGMPLLLTSQETIQHSFSNALFRLKLVKRFQPTLLQVINWFGNQRHRHHSYLRGRPDSHFYQVFLIKQKVPCFQERQTVRWTRKAQLCVHTHSPQ